MSEIRENEMRKALNDFYGIEYYEEVYIKRIKMKITYEYLIDFLIKVYSKKNAHEDYQNLYKEQLSIILKYLEIPELITFDKNGIELKLIKDYINLYIENDMDLNNILLAANLTINKDLKLLNGLTDSTIRNRYQLTTNKEIEFFHREIKSDKDDYAIKMINESLIKIYRNSIRKILIVLYATDFNDIDNIKKGFNINVKVTDKRDILKLNEELCDFDYF